MAVGVLSVNFNIIRTKSDILEMPNLLTRCSLLFVALAHIDLGKEDLSSILGTLYSPEVVDNPQNKDMKALGWSGR
jgi:hypothetical protein